jgi:predicted nucleotide-binding protein
MAVDNDLFDAIKKKTGRSRSAIYRMIADQAGRLSVRPDVAALEVASRTGVNFQRFASEEQLEKLREARMAVGRDSVATAPPIVSAARARGKGRQKPKGPGKHVMIVHGRNDKIRKAMFDFIRSLGLEPIEWNTAVKWTKQASPYVGDVLRKAFERASAVVVILTPDDDAVLKKQFQHKHDESWEKKLTGQARPNVLFEAGMAFGTHPSQTVMVEFGKCRPFTDTQGRLVVRMNDTAAKRKDLVDRLAAAGCEVDTSTNAWMEAGDFSFS